MITINCGIELLFCDSKLVNDKIDEFSLLEKQLDTDIYRQTFQLTELKDWLKANVERIILDQEVIRMDVKKLPFRLEYLTALGLGIYEPVVVIKVLMAERLVLVSNC